MPFQLHQFSTTLYVFNSCWRKRDFWHFSKNTCVFRENISLCSLLNQSWTYQGSNPCGIYPWLIFHLWKWRHLIHWPVPSDLLLIRITSSGIRASALDTGSILYDIFFLCILSHSPFVFCSIIFIVVVFVLVFVLVFVRVFVFCLFYSILFLCLLVVDGLFVPCYIRILFCSTWILFGMNSACWMNLGFGSNCLTAHWTNCLIAYWIWTSGIDWTFYYPGRIVKSTLYKK